MRRQKNKQRLHFIVFVSIALCLIFGVYLFYDLPSIESLPERLSQPSIRITDRDGRLLYDLLPEDSGRQVSLASENIPQCIKDATVAVEDENFYSHPGFDLKGIVRALWINLQSGETKSGGSTITQQVVRILLFDDEERTERSIRRKAREAVLAWQLTRRYSKDEVLALYLNYSYYGGMAYGVEAASQTYFGKPASDLLLPECALLAGLTQTPGLYNPFTNPNLALERQKVVLGLMQKHGFISEEEKLSAEQMPLEFNPAPYPVEAPHFIWLIKDRLDEMFLSGELDPQESLIVRTTLDLNMQHVVEATARRHIERFQMETGVESHNVNNAAVVVIDPTNGDVLALTGSADYFDVNIHGAINMAALPRQTGSAFKPFIYALALTPSGPQAWTAGTTILDASTTFTMKNAQPYTPYNYDGMQRGYVSMRESLASSLNIPAVRTLEKVGIDDTVSLAKELGITSLERPDEYDLSLALGGGEVSLLELTSAYATLANQGVHTGYELILDIKNADGILLYKFEREEPVQVIDPRVTWLISDILSDDRARSLTFGANSALKLDRVAAVKTGTTTNFHDNWTIGYTPDLTVGVWVGNSTYEPMRNVTGLTGAGPIWHDVMRAVLEGRPEQAFIQPEGLKQVEICALSGLLPTEFCEHTKTEWFINGTEPTSFDTFYKQIWIDRTSGALASDSTPAEHKESLIVLDLPFEAQAWAREQGLPLLVDYSNSAIGRDQLVVQLPANNATFIIYPHLDITAQQIQISVSGGGDISQVTLWMDGNVLTSFSAPPYTTWWILSAGEHQLWVEGVGANGERIKSNEVNFSVLNQ